MSRARLVALLGVLAILAVLALHGTGCAASPSASPAPPGAYQTPEKEVAGTRSGYTRTVADIEAGFQHLLSYTDIRGQELSQAADARVTVVVFFATWCRPCRRELGWLEEMMRAESRLQIIGINIFDEEGPDGDLRVHTFVDEKVPWLQVVRADQALADAFGRPRYVPSTFLFDGAGRLLQAYLPPARKPPTREEFWNDIQPFMSDAFGYRRDALARRETRRKAAQVAKIARFHLQ